MENISESTTQKIAIKRSALNDNKTTNQCANTNENLLDITEDLSSEEVPCDVIAKRQKNDS